MAREDYKGIWVFAEQEHGTLHPTVFELLAKAAELKAVCGETITAVLLGSGVRALTQELFDHGADEVILAEDDALAEYSARPYQAAFTQLAQRGRPSIVLFGATPLGRDLAPRVMVSLDTGLTADAIDVGFDDDGVFCQTTPAYGGKILAHIAILERRPQMVTVHPQICRPLELVPGSAGILHEEKVDVRPDLDYLVVETVSAEGADEAIDAAPVVVAGGRGIKSQEDLAMLGELAELLGGQLASSRPLVDCGWLEHDRQIGQSGVTVAPKVIINAAISGSVQYQLGMRNAECIVAVNKAADAPIFDIAHFGIVDDYRNFIPALIEELKRQNQ